MANRKSPGKRPTHNLCIIGKDETGGKFHTIGAGWENDRGAISLSLNKGTTISWRDMEDHALYVFKNEESE